MPLPVLKPMRATNRPMLVVTDGWAIEPKLHGSRALVYVDDHLRVRTRRGRDITAVVPDLHGIHEQLPPGTILDGELLAAQGMPRTLSRLVSRLVRRRPIEVSFRAFDLLAVNGVLVTSRPYRTRRGLLEKLRFEGPSWCTTTAFTEAGVEALQACVDAGLEDLVRKACVEAGIESLVFKHLDSLYEPGKRTRRWVRVALSTGDVDGGHASIANRARDRSEIVTSGQFGK